MKTTIWAAVLTALGAGAAFAQEGDFRREFEKRVRELEERFRAEREKLEKEFQDKRQKLMPRREEGAPPRLEALVEKLIERVERLERRLDEGLGRALPKDFDFKRFMPRFEDRDFKFEFRRPEGDKDDSTLEERVRKLLERAERQFAPEKRAEKKHGDDDEKKVEKKKAEKKHEDDDEREKKKSKEKGF